MSTVFALAVYFIVWWVTLFTVLPFCKGSQDEAGDVVPGTPGSAPSQINIWKVFGINTVVASIVFAVIWVLMVNGILSTDMMVLRENSPV